MTKMAVLPIYDKISVEVFHSISQMTLKIGIWQTELKPYNFFFFFFTMPPTSKKLEEHIASGVYVRPFVTLFDA